MKNNLDVPIASVHYDDSYCTRQHAFNIGLAYGAAFAALSLCVVIVFRLQAIWFLRGIMISLLIGVCAFAKALVDFTQEARDIQWQEHVPQKEVEPQFVPATLEPLSPDVLRAHFPSPTHTNGMLFTDVRLTEQQRIAIAQSALNHGKLTINYLTAIGVKRDDAERLREELVAHGLLKFNEHNEVVITEDGARSFKKLIR